MIKLIRHYDLYDPHRRLSQDEPDWLQAEQDEEDWLRAQQDEQDRLRTEQQILTRQQ